MVHRRTNFDAGWKSVDNEPASLSFQNLQETFRIFQIIGSAMDRGRQLAFEVSGDVFQFGNRLGGNQN